MASGSKKAIYAALAANSAIAVTKFIAAGITNSSAMLSEGIHSVVDTGNQALLLFGMNRGKRGPDDRHPFGYGMEVYFWSFVVAILLFSIGAGVAMYEGIHKVMDPHPIENPMVSYVVLSAAILIEAGSWWVAFKEFNAVRGKRGWLRSIRDSKDPVLFTVLFEDTGAMLGLVVALVGTWVGVTFNLPVMDGVASIIIGVLLGLAAIILAIETKGLLIGEAADAETIAEIKTIITETLGVEQVHDLRTMHLAPQQILVTLSVDWDDAMTADQIENTVASIKREVTEKRPAVRHLYIEAFANPAKFAEPEAHPS